jgi:hypothetical protein
MTDLKKFEYFFLRYAPLPMMDDYVSFGVVVLESSPDGFAGVRFMKNWRRMLCSHPDADLDYFRFLEQDIREHLAVGTRREELLAKFYDCFANTIQISANKECMAENPQAALDLLARGSIDLPAHAVRPETGARRRILQKIEAVFEQAGIWTLLGKNVAVAEYTYPGDPLKIDALYRPNGVVKMLQAVPLQMNIDAAKILAFSYPQLVKGIEEKKHIGTLLTAVVDDDIDRNNPEMEFAVTTMERSGITVARTIELPLIAERARQELQGKALSF